MTTVPLDSPASPAAQLVTPDPDTRLAQLLAQYDLAEAEAKKAAEAFEAIKAGIKHELAEAAPGATDVRIDSPALSTGLRMSAVVSWRVDAQRLKKEAPETYVRYAKKSTSWTLRRIAS